MAVVEMLLSGKRSVSFRQVASAARDRVVPLPQSASRMDCVTQSNRDGLLRQQLSPGIYQVFVDSAYYDIIRVPDSTATYGFRQLVFFVEPGVKPPAPGEGVGEEHLRLSGGVMAGDIYLPRTPNATDSGLMAATKEYVDQRQDSLTWVHRQLMSTSTWNIVVPDSVGLMVVSSMLLVDGDEWDSSVEWDLEAEDVRGVLQFGETVSGELRIQLATAS